MAVLSDLLGFPHHTCARGSKVERPFLVDLAKALRVPSPESFRTKEALLVAAAERATGGLVSKAVMTSPNGQGTVKNEALDVIIDGVLGNALGVPLVGAVTARVAADLEAAKRPDADAAFDALNLSDERKASLRLVVDRPGQKRFRDAVVGAYPGCAVTGCLEAAVLDAAHIRPYRGPYTNIVRNGICLRTDLHRLWDRGLLAVHERSRRVLVHPQVRDTAYRALDGAHISTPTDPKQWPDTTALQLQRQWCGL
jgi:hypothetical protein